jgi:hypothetical protein
VRVRGFFAWVLLLCAAAGPAHADDPARARALAATAAEKAAAGDLAGALALYEAALAIDPSPRYRCNIGVAHYRLEDWPAAYLHFGLCLAHADTLEPAYVAQARRARDFVEERLRAGGHAPVQLEVRPESAVIRLSAIASGQPFPPPRRVWLPLGEHWLEVQAEGHVAHRVSSEVTSPSSMVVSVQLQQAPPAPAAAAGIVAAPATGAPARDDEAVSAVSPVPVTARAEPLAPRRGRGLRRGAGAAWATAGIGLAVGAGAHLHGHGLRRQLLRSDDDRDRKVAQLERDNRLLGVGYSTAVIAGGLGVYLWMRAARRDRAVVGAAPAPGGGVVWATLRF